MKRITKAEAKQFTAALKSAALEIGFRPFIPDPSGHDKDTGALWVMTVYGRYRLVTDNDESGDSTFWVFGRFIEPARLPRTHGVTCADWNTHSGKWNFYGYEWESAINSFRRAMARANARPATPEEIAAYDAADLAEYAKWEAFRKEGV